MKLTVIVPALEEERFVGRCVTALRREHAGEILVIDGGSSDATMAVARAAGAAVLVADRGYARQANAGAAAATGDVLFFLAADSVPEPGWRAAIEETLASPYVVAGGFHLRLDDEAWPYRVIEWGGNFRSRYVPVALPDQGLFVRREAFAAVGGMVEGSRIPNARLCFDLRRYGDFVLRRERVLSSARKWHQHGLVRTSLRHMGLYMSYRYRELPR